MSFWLSHALEGRYLALTVSILATLALAAAAATLPGYGAIIWAPLTCTAFLSIIGLSDLTQTRHAILRNYPILGHLRFFFEKIRPEMRQYFFESDQDGAPFPRERRAIVYQRAKRELDKKPFGTHGNVYAEGHEWMLHSMMPAALAVAPFRVTVGGPDCRQPYSASVFNISAMSYGALSANAIRALNKGARLGNFAHDTGEGSISPYHREFNGDLIWELGSGYFGCRNLDGSFSDEHFAESAASDQVKMIEIKLSQGAKPGHGGVLPAAKITEEISKIRGVPMGEDCISPARHSAFSTPVEMMAFIARLRNLSGGKPVGFKLCIGHRREFFALVRAMLETGITPDFIVIDGKEGGTGAAPAEFIDNIGMPLRDGLAFVHSALIGAGLRDQIRLGAAGKVITGFDMARAHALGADWCNAARGFMFAVGCIQAQTCHTGHCPTGVATQDMARQNAVVITDKSQRVASFHKETVKSLAELLAAAGFERPSDLRPHHIFRRAGDGRVTTLADQFTFMEPGALLSQKVPPVYATPWNASRPDRF
ncbi:MAG: FMN-binding glutamate synthase family protein [Proteobacteria bacterium]|nr:FMN-binding glutamate synthase family protein [Pseudomonadota bacterium]